LTALKRSPAAAAARWCRSCAQLGLRLPACTLHPAPPQPLVRAGRRRTVDAHHAGRQSLRSPAS